MENIFIYQDVWYIVKDGYDEPAAGVILIAEQQTALTTNRKNNSKETNILHQGIHESLMDRVLYIKEAKAAWDGLVNYYKGSDKVKKAYEQRLLEKIATAKTVEQALQSQVKWTNNQGNSSSGGRSNNGNYQGRYYFGGRSNNGGYQGRKPVDKAKLRCYNCGDLGHFYFDCPNPRKTTENNYKANFKANIAESEEEEEEEQKAENILLACHTAEEQPQIKWYLDNGCRNQMCGIKDLFDELDESVRSTVKFGNSSTIPVMGKGRI
ncbi:uncharacterized protein LOC113290543 [Papaver somniferum]|uniref:uncharacterized protein LOC113290543 n=1 Tax=Papaver somniferum TaxID=3469 RepID=UPI000E6FC12F|nr:uncharacterized protein LOC113290543 [Papaver somniferum]